MPPGNHNITFTATDHGGLTSTASVQVTVVNKPPNEPFINSPPAAASVTAGCNIIFSGGAYDQEDTFITGTGLVWSSNIDGIIGTGAELKDKLTTPGTHLVRLTAIDSVGESSFKEHTINVNPSTDGCPPTVKIVSPPSEGKGAVVIFSPQNITLVGKVCYLDRQIAIIIIKSPVLRMRKILLIHFNLNGSLNRLFLPGLNRLSELPYQLRTSCSRLQGLIKDSSSRSRLPTLVGIAQQIKLKY